MGDYEPSAEVFQIFWIKSAFSTLFQMGTETDENNLQAVVLGAGLGYTSFPNSESKFDRKTLTVAALSSCRYIVPALLSPYGGP
jgi:hypothetical protein